MIYALEDESIIQASSYNDTINNDESSVIKKLIKEFGQQIDHSIEDSEVTEEKVEDYTVDKAVITDSEDNVNSNDITIVIETKEVKNLLTRRASIAFFTPNRAMLEQDDVERKAKQNQENIDQGGVKQDVYISYFKACGVTIFLFFAVVTNFIGFLKKWWLKIWSDAGDGNSKNDHDLFYYVGVYGLISFTFSLFTMFRSLSVTRHACLRAAKILHNKMIVAVIKAPLQLVETTLLGRITNRFSTDFSIIDKNLPYTFS